MRILHTADWHLGHRLYDRDRTEEHRAALAWLLDLVVRENIDLVIVAGDVFDVSNPSNQAKKLYYDFLAGLQDCNCAAAVIVGGNHDSPSLLDAPADLLRTNELHVVGAARSRVRDQLIRARVGEAEGRTEVLIAAVPYLREQDLRRGSYGESHEDRLTALRTGIQGHYEAIAQAAADLRDDPTTPIIATGHLFASGAEDNEGKVSHIYQADEHNIEAGRFPAVFDYVALGHVHRAQSVDGNAHVRYSGSLVPLTFVEGQQPRSVRIVEVGKAGEEVKSHSVYVPYHRTLLRLRGDLETVKAKLTAATVEFLEGADWAERPRPWAEVRVLSEAPIPNLRRVLEDHLATVEGDAAGQAIEILRLSRDNPTPVSTEERLARRTRRLDELDPADVFTDLLDRSGHADEDRKQLLAEFAALRNYCQEQDPAAT